ncbi:MAG: metallophosphoesterase, partial [Deltaproteobacteria bacterium]|nr:metallophosphoesterase [Deltaproteobacteria bacterium]
MSAPREVLILHTSDLHLGADSILTDDDSGNVPVLEQVLSTAREQQADLVILAGDTFDHNRQGARLLEEVSEVMEGCGLPIVILPGNHDPLTPDSVYRRAEFTKAGNVHVL